MMSLGAMSLRRAAYANDYRRVKLKVMNAVPKISVENLLETIHRCSTVDNQQMMSV